ncbi:MAG: carboxylesterase family protein [Promethearchaeota archaeon]
MREKFIEKLNRALTLKNVSLTSIILNISVIALSILYISKIDLNLYIWDILGVLIILAVLVNLLLDYMASLKVNRIQELGKKINLFTYIYPVFVIIGMFGIAFGNLLISVTYSNKPIDNIGGFALLYVGFYLIIGFGLLMGLLIFRNLDNTSLWAPIESNKLPPTTRNKRITKLILKIFCYITIVFCIYFAYVILLGFSDYVTGIVSIFVAQFGALIGFNCLATFILLLKVKSKKQNPKAYKIIGIMCIIITPIFFLPLIATNLNIYYDEKNFADAFGSDWRDKIPDDVEKKYFMQKPFVLGSYYLGIPPKDCNYKINVKYYEDDEVTLYFDVYWPKTDKYSELPGNGSIMIRIHGGGWVFGDKGWADMMQVAKYFAAQGYVVYDIQYRLNDMNGLLDFDPLTPKYRKGDFNMDDIIESLGFFTKYLASHNDYDGNLNSVFVTGGSAGGHLTCALGLGIASGKYKDIFGDNLTIKGIIPFYPGNGLSTELGIKGTKELVDPTLLVDKNSPPCLIYQGTSDGLVKPWISQSLKDKYDEEGNEKCAIIWMPLTGHSNDIYFEGYCQQIFLYYMERFCYLAAHDKI